MTDFEKKLELARSLEEEEPEQAERIYRELLGGVESEGEDFKFGVYIGLGRTLDSLTRYREAIPFYIAVANLAPKSSFLAGIVGWTYYQAGDLIEAEHWFEKATELRKPDADTFVFYGAVLNDLGRPERGLAAFRRATEIDPMHDEAHYNVGGALLKQRRFREALPHFETALTLDPNYDRAFWGRGRCRYERGHPIADVIHDLNLSRNLDPDLLFPCVDLAIIRWRFGDPKGALELFDEAYEGEVEGDYLATYKPDEYRALLAAYEEYLSRR